MNAEKDEPRTEDLTGIPKSVDSAPLADCHRGESAAKRAVRTIRAKLADWKPDHEDLATIQGLAQRSLTDIIHLTEYEDGKASRIATMMSFLGVLAGGVYAATFNLFAQYPCALFLTYVGVFFAFVIVMLVSLGWVVWAIYPRFFVPRRKEMGAGDLLTSFVFPPFIVTVTPDKWADAFRSSSGHTLKREYAIQDICESYLVATKVVHKFNHMRRAMNAMKVACCFFIAWDIVLVSGLVCQQMAKSGRDLAGTIVMTAAGNVLWDSNRVFDSAQVQLVLGLCKTLNVAEPANPSEYVRRLDQQIAATNEVGLRYPAELLVQALLSSLVSNAAIGTVTSTLPSSCTLRTLTHQYALGVRQSPSLFPGVLDTLEVLTNRGATIVVVSESNRQDCFSWLKSFGLLPFVSSVWTGEKSRGFYEQIIRKMQSAKRIVVVGDQLERDIRPAKEAGLITVYKPSAFSPVWKNAAHEAYADYTISSFADLVRVVDDEVSLVQ